jgi:hypothetical protein
MHRKFCRHSFSHNDSIGHAQVVAVTKAEYVGGGSCFGHAGVCVATGSEFALGEIDDACTIALGVVRQQCATTTELSIIGMSDDGQDIELQGVFHRASSV